MTQNRIGSNLELAKEALRWRGPKLCAAIAARQMMRPLMDWYVLHIMETHVDPAGPTSPPPGPFNLRVFDSSCDPAHVSRELSPILALQPADIPLRLKTGDAVAVAYHEETAVGCTWLTFGTRLGVPTGLSWKIGPREAVSYGSFVVPSWRGKRVHKSLDDAVNAYLRTRSIDRTYGSMSALNPQTLSLARKTGKRMATTLLLVRVKGLGWTFRWSFGEPLDSHFRLPRTGATLEMEPAVLES